MRRAAAAVALIEQHNAIARRIEEAAHAFGATRTRPAMQHQRGLAVGIAADFPIDALAVPHIQHPRLERFDPWIKPGHASVSCASSASSLTSRILLKGSVNMYL